MTRSFSTAQKLFFLAQVSTCMVVATLNQSRLYYVPTLKKWVLMKRITGCYYNKLYVGDR